MRDYKQIWNNLSTTFADASFYVCCIGDEDEIRRNGEITAQFLTSVLQIGPTDKVLEIGCGVARIGRELAAACGEWHGCDISGNMIAHAKERVVGIPNISLHELPENSLSIFPDDTFDCVYCTIVFMHIDKPDMFTYMSEARRVLKPGGRAYFDTYNILAPEAWQEFRKILEAYPPGTPRPGHLSQFSTPQEFRKFMDEAGFDSIHVDDRNPQLVVALGRKPFQQNELGQELERLRAHTAHLAADLREQQAELEGRAGYISNLEAEVARKDAALADLAARVRQVEQELITAREPRLPWKRR